MQASRRTVLKAVAAAAATGGLQAFPSRAAAAAAGPVAEAGTTLAATVQPGGALVGAGTRGEYRRLQPGPGEPHVLREDLGVRAQQGRVGRRRALLAFAHLTDIHVIDAQSPARVEYLDRYDDDERFATLFSSAYRPHEALCAQLADSIVAAVRQVGVGPVTGAPLAYGLCTGDNTDNAQLNELQWQIDLLNGRPFAANSGDAARFEGVSDEGAARYEDYWHPTLPAGATPDHPRVRYGFPTIEGLLEAAIAQFTPTGIGMPWYTAFGNHDGLVQGNFPASFNLTLAAEGPLKVMTLPAETKQEDVSAALEDGDLSGVRPLEAQFVREVTPDPLRRVISRLETVKEHFTRGGSPMGHGYTAQNLADGTAYYTFEPTPLVRGIVLDTVNPNGYANGSIDATQHAWLRQRLEEVSGPGRDKLVVVYSHHTADTMDNPIVFVDDPSGPRVQGDEVVATLLEFPNVVLWLNGHTHVNRVTPRTRPDGGGFWEVSTAAHIDFPCQARLVELVDNADGTLSVFGTLVDAAAGLVPTYDLSTSQGRSTANLASIAREVAANDWQAGDGRGDDGDRNVELLVAAPFDLTRTATAPVPAQQPVTPAEPLARSLPATGLDAAGAVVAAGALGLGAVVARRQRAAAPTED